jgi:hypothetical protein
MDAGEILKLKLGLRMEEDVTAWAFEEWSVLSSFLLQNVEERKGPAGSFQTQ